MEKKDDWVYSKPELNQYLSDKNIIDICCGHNFSVVLTSNGEVYAWGENRNGQIGNGSKELYQLIPSKVNGFNDEKVVMISCGSLHSMALTESGLVFSWGNNSSGQLGHSYNGFGYGNVNEPSLLNLNNEILIKKISCGSQHSILLSSDGDIYTFGDNSKYQLGSLERDNNHSIPLKLEYKNKFIDIAAQYHISIALSVNNVFHVWGKVGDHLISTRPKKTEFQTFNDIFNHYYEITHKTLDFDNEYKFYNNKDKIKC
jgi:RCC1 and BTB domain-containing protein